jgi:membrane protease subunit (stomatin/prohibitin family)
VDRSIEDLPEREAEMGIIDKLRAELVDIVEWVDDSQHTIVWRFPRFHNQIKSGAQLIVRPGQSAILVSHGKIADRFEPGQYSLETKNIPILSTMLGWYHGFDSPFKAEVYFINTTRMTDLKWGTPNPVIVRDPDYGPVRVRAFGTYSLRAVDGERLLRELVGTDSVFEADEVSEWLRSIINMTFADIVSDAEIGVLDLAGHYQELSERLRCAVQERIDNEYGLELPKLNIVNISLPAQVEQAIDARSSMGIVGDLGQYQAFQSANATPDAAQNPAGGIAGAGLGLGMGMSMAGPMLRHQSQNTNLQAPPPLPSARTWHFAENGEPIGPWVESKISEAIRAGRIRRETLLWSAGLDSWIEAAQAPEFAAQFSPDPPPLP